jgi:hypothetical protein
MIAGAEVFGIWGAILAAPTIGLFQALVGAYRRILAVVSKEACEGVSAGEALQTPFLSDVWPNNVVFTISFVLIGLHWVIRRDMFNLVGGITASWSGSTSYFCCQSLWFRPLQRSWARTAATPSPSGSTVCSS